MTHRVYFHADRSYLSFAKAYLGKSFENHDAEVDEGSVCVIALVCALEAIVNSLFRDHTVIRHFDDFRLQSKIETLFDLGSSDFDWGREPLQSVGELIRTRNWLVHFKEPEIGLLGTEGYVSDTINRLPRFDPDTILTRKHIQRQYQSVLDVGVQLAACLKAESEYEFLREEDFRSFYVR